MRAAVRAGVHRVEIADVPDPVVVEPTDAVVRVVLAAVCGTDLWGYRGVGEIPPGPRAGHEFLGVVEDVGSAVGLKRGDLVLAPFMWSDGTCGHCRNGLPSSCAAGGMWGGGHDGGQGEAVRVPFADATLVRLPAETTDARLPAVLALADVMSTGWYATRHVEAGSEVAVIGDGAVGLCSVLAAVRRGAARVVLVSRHEARASIGLKFGAAEIAERGTAKHLDVVIECAGTQDAVDSAINAVRDGGTVSLVGAPHVALRADQVFLRNLTVTGGLAPTRVIIPELLDDVVTGRLDPSPIFDFDTGLDGVPEAYQRMHDRTAVKALIRVEEVR